MVEINQRCKELMPKGMRKKEAREMAKIFNKCTTLKQKSKKARKDAVMSQKLLTQHLNGIDDFVDDHINVVNLGSKYIQGCVKEFKKNHAAFVYGKKDGEAHFVKQNGESVFKNTQRIGKLNPKYVEMIQKMTNKDQSDDEIQIFD